MVVVNWAPFTFGARRDRGANWLAAREVDPAVLSCSADSAARPFRLGPWVTPTGLNPPEKVPSTLTELRLAGGPPRRSQRARLTHWALALGTGVEPHARPGMQDAGGW